MVDIITILALVSIGVALFILCNIQPDENEAERERRRMYDDRR